MAEVEGVKVEQTVETPAPDELDTYIAGEEASATAQTRKHLETMGGKFSPDGKFLGFGQAEYGAVEDEDDDDEELTELTPKQLKQKIAKTVQQSIMPVIVPQKINSLVESFVSSEPLFEGVKDEALKVIQAMNPAQINEQSVKLAFYTTLGMKAPELIANAKKEAVGKAREVSRAASASAAVTEGGGERAGGNASTGVKITPDIIKTANAMGLKPEDLAEAMKAKGG